MPAAIAESFAFDDLGAKAKEHALKRYRDWWVQDDWWNNVYEDAAHMAELLGISIDEKHGLAIYFSGFWSQGDGASFMGTYRPRADAYDALRMHTDDETLVNLAERLTVLNVGWMLTPDVIGVRAGIRISSSRYCHSASMNVEIDFLTLRGGVEVDDDSTELTACMREFADWIYKQLEAEHEYLTSDEFLTEQFCDGETKFDEDGDMI